VHYCNETCQKAAWSDHKKSEVHKNRGRGQDGGGTATGRSRVRDISKVRDDRFDFDNWIRSLRYLSPEQKEGIAGELEITMRFVRENPLPPKEKLTPFIRREINPRTAKLKNGLGEPVLGEIAPYKDHVFEGDDPLFDYELMKTLFYNAGANTMESREAIRNVGKQLAAREDVGGMMMMRFYFYTLSVIMRVPGEFDGFNLTDEVMYMFPMTCLKVIEKCWSGVGDWMA